MRSFLVLPLLAITAAAATNEPQLRGGIRHLATAHENDVYFDAVQYNGVPSHNLVDFSCATSLAYSQWDKTPATNTYTITSGQPWKFEGCSLSNGHAKLSVSAGRHKSNGPADFFNNGLKNTDMTGAYVEDEHTPAQLNFAMNLDLHFTYSDGTTVTATNVRIGQGSTINMLNGEPVNNWWLGGPNWVYNEVGVVYDYEALKNGATVNTVAIGWYDYNSEGSYIFQLAYCKECTMASKQNCRTRGTSKY